MSKYQKLVAKKMAMFYRKRDGRGRFLCGTKNYKPKTPMLFWDMVHIEAKKEARKMLEEILTKLK